jgi:hypothetical protein
VTMIYDVVLMEMRDIVVSQVKDVVRTVAVRLMLWAATVAVIASRRQDMRPLALTLTTLLIMILLRGRLRPVLKQEDIANTRIHFNAVVGDIFSAIQAERGPISLVVKTPVAFNLRTINQCTVGKIEDTVV